MSATPTTWAGPSAVFANRIGGAQFPLYEETSM